MRSGSGEQAGSKERDTELGATRPKSRWDVPKPGAQ